jgi:hypothetical protein
MRRFIDLARASLASLAVLALASCAGAGGYGPLKVNLDAGADFYVVQDGALVPVEVTPDAITLRLANRPFEIGTNAEQMNLCLTQVEVPEVRADPRGNRASCLSGPFQSAKAPDSAELFVFSGKSWSDGNNLFQVGAHRAATPRAGYARAYRVNDLLFVDAPKTGFATFSGTLYGYIVVYREHVRRNRDIMPIRLVFGG